MSEYELNILWLYPDILNLHGDRGNAMALVRVARQLGVTPRLTRVEHLGDRFDIGDTDIILAGAGELVVMADVVAALEPHTTQLREYVNAGGGFYASGASGAIVAQRTVRLQDSHIPGLGLVDLELRERQEIYGDDLVLAVDDEEVLGIQIRMVNYHLGPSGDQEPFGRVLYGLGNSGKDREFEGLRHDNLIATNLLGPALVKNPWFTAHLIGDVLARKYSGVTFAPTQSDSWVFERQSAAAIRRFNATKRTLPGVLQLL